MSKPTPSPLDRRIRQAHRRLFLQGLIQRVVASWAIALAAGVAWFLLEPLIIDAAPEAQRWIVLGSLVAVGTLAAIVWAIRSAPTRLAAALTLDQRFDLRERVTTALSLSEADMQSSAGQALIADANQRAENIDVRRGLPLRLGRRSLLIPLQGCAIALLALFYQPMISNLNAGGNGSDGGKANAKADIKDDAAAKAAANRPPIRKPPERSNKSEELKQLEAELDKLYAGANAKPEQDEKPEQVREKVEQIAQAEERLKKAEAEKAEKFQRLQEQMQKLGSMDKDEFSKDGPGHDFADALSKGDLQKAKEAVDELRKKSKEKKLDEKDAQQLKKQLEDMAEKLERLSRNQEQKEKLQKLIDQAKKEGRDAEALEREMQRLEKESAGMKELQDLAKKLGECKKCLDAKDFDGLAEKLGEAGKEIEGMMEQLADLEDLDEHLQNLKEMRERLCKKCQGGQCEGEGEGDYAQGRGRASGKRPENPNAQSNSEDARQRGRFDPRGKKSYAGAVNGPAFTKKTSVEMAGEIQQAVQEAPEAIEVQRLPKAAREMVREYFEKLGGQGPPR